jgi:hypothetical protein
VPRRKLGAAALMGTVVAACGLFTASAAQAGDFEAALAALGGSDLVLIEPPRRPGQPPRVLTSTLVAAPAAAVQAVLANPALYREALPSLVRAEVVARRPRSGSPVADQLTAWEVEIPLFNLAGRGWLSAVSGGVELTLTEGALAPGRIRVTTSSPAVAGAAAGTVLTVEMEITVRNGGWFLRRMAAASPFAEGAVSAAAAWVVLRATAERAEHPEGPTLRRPRVPPAPPRPDALAGSALGAAALAPLRARGVVAAVKRAPSGRLAAVSVAPPIALAPALLTSRLAEPESWRAFPGLKKVTRRPPGTPGRAAPIVEVEDSLPFVDFDAAWEVRPGLRATAIEGDIRGASFGWEVLPAPPARGGTASSLAIFSLYPRIETSGYIPRRFVAAEPLLEHATALALGYVNAMSMKRHLEQPALGQ